MLSIKTVFYKYLDEQIQLKADKEGFLIFTAEDLLRPAGEMELWKEIKQLGHRQKAALVMGLSFNTNPVFIPKLSSLLWLSDNDLKHKILMKAHLYIEAFKKLNDHITYVKKIISQKKNKNL